MRPRFITSSAVLASVAVVSATGAAGTASAKPVKSTGSPATHAQVVRKETRVARSLGGSVLPAGVTVNVPLDGGGATGQGSATDAECNQIAQVVNNLQEWGNQRYALGDADGFNQAYDQSQKYVDDGMDAGCFFIY
jgi:hypothetical protein